MLEVIKPGLQTTVQDLGRSNGLAYGIPVCGAMDLTSAKLANQLVGNPISNPVIESTVIGPDFKVKSDCVVAFTGAISNLQINSMEVEQNKAYKVNIGDVISIGNITHGRFVYMAIQGLFEVDDWWGSRSTFTLAHKGGFEGRNMKRGDVLKVAKCCAIEYSVKEKPIVIDDCPIIKIDKGPEFELFPQSDFKLLFDRDLELSADSNRIGFRMKDIHLKGTQSGNITSSGVLPGTIQVPSSGEPIVLMKDGPCTGGYPRIGIICENDLNRFAQIMPGDKYRFQLV